MKRASGFTLMEVIGVMAVIGIIAAIATPRIFAAIEDAKVTNLVQQANDLKAVVATYYKDTGRWPRHIPSHTDTRYHNLMLNDAGSGATIPGWDGPYLDSELVHPVSAGSYQDVIVTNNASWACDITGDGTPDGTWLVYRVDNIADDVAKKVSHMIDKDGDRSDWKTYGKVKRYAGTHAHILLMCLANV